jgi:isopentenyl phosphate kinase
VASVEALIAAGIVPILHGDVVLDEARRGCAVLSGDTIVRHLALALQPRPAFVIFLTNVSGIYDRPPDLPTAALVPEIVVAPDGSWALPGGGAIATSVDDSTDVTGGIETKIAEAAAIARHGVPVLITRAGGEGARQALQEGAGVRRVHDSWEGTLVRAADWGDGA